MNRLCHAVLAATALTLAAATARAQSPPKSTSVPAPPVLFQTQFDPLGPAVQALPGTNKRTVHFTDTGETGWRPVLFLGGTGTSARAFLMTGYLETLRRQLHLRFISVERNGFGAPPSDFGPFCRRAGQRPQQYPRYVPGTPARSGPRLGLHGAKSANLVALSAQ